MNVIYNSEVVASRDAFDVQQIARAGAGTYRGRVHRDSYNFQSWVHVELWTPAGWTTVYWANADEVDMPSPGKMRVTPDETDKLLDVLYAAFHVAFRVTGD